MMKCIKSVVVVVACLCGLPLFADNLRLSDAVRVVSATDQAVELEVSLSWNNSWRTRHNWDAVYLFGKYQVSGSTVWHHLYFSLTAGSHSSAAAVELQPGNSGRGLFVRRSTEGSGAMTATLRLTANPKGNTDSPFTAAAVNSGSVLFSMQGIEMVQIPTAPFYAGDQSAPGAFSDGSFGSLLPEYDLINTTSGYTYSANGSESSSANASRAANRNPQGTYNASSRQDWCGTAFPAWWQVDFKTAKEIRYFGVSGVSGLAWGGFPPVPASDWFLEGSNDASVWRTVWSGGPESWGQSSVSYPVQAIRVTSPGSYRYYRIRVTDNQCPALWNNIRLSNVGMMEADLSSLPNVAPVPVTYGNALLPTNYPSGFHGFYAMKYELTQEQYVTFLNMLSRSAQYGRTMSGLLDVLNEGEYLFGPQRDVPSFRNGIVLKKKNPNTELPYVFGCDLTETDLDNSGKDGQATACNYLSVSDMLAYADWSGLRPLSELEYEKMCRGNFLPDPDPGSFAWETSAAIPLTGLTAPGEVTEGVPVGSTANTNLGSPSNSVGAPVRAGLFIRPGSREQTGLSYWGVSDLTGNLSEIYCNAEIYGRQLNRTVHGGGRLDMDGSPVVSASNWPVEAAAYGVRGSDYASVAGSSSAFERSRAADYFADADTRLPTTGVRLGFSVTPVAVMTQLTLENGLRSSSSIVYDTVCSAVSYVIRGDRHGSSDVPSAVYFWYESTDNGSTWKLMEGVSGQDLVLENLTSRVSANVVNRFRYRRVSMGMESQSETGTVCLVIVHGSTVSQSLVTLYPCMAPPTLTVTTVLPSTFEWTCLETDKILGSTGTATSSSYTVKQADLKTGSERPNGLYNLEVRITMAGQCVQYQKAQVHCAMQTLNPFSMSSELITWSTSDTYTVPHSWGGEDTWTWKVYTSLSSIQINNSGTISGKAANAMAPIVVGMTCNAFPDKEWTKSLRETRTLSYTGNYQTLTLSPGTYQMECWGADGGAGNGGSNPAGYGGYTRGTIAWPTTQNCYVYVGEFGNGVSTARGFNGGGPSPAAGSGHNGGRGGSATDIRLTSGTWNTTASLRSRIMVAGGGGGAQPNCGGSATTAGHAGGLTGTTSLNTAGTYVNNRSFGGSQTAGGSFQLGSSANNNGVVGSFGTGASSNTCAAGGGSGYYGGGSLYTSGGGGGSSFISGYPGCDAVNSSGAHTGQPVHYSNLVFTNTVMTAGASRGSIGNGKVVITVVGAL